jgi:3-phenylpropionate/trans-cinnamate dioxygenase ferredoxin component
MPTENDWTPVIATEELPEGRATKVEALGTSVMVYRSGETVFAVASRCTHQGAPLERGVVKAAASDPTVTCPAHGSVFSLVNGAVRRGPAAQPVQAFEARIGDRMIELRARADLG